MSDYTFENLSGTEFEKLVRDLLQKHFALTLQSFPPGPDGGIDLLFSQPEANTVVVQCKQYAQTGFSGLLSVMRKEAAKLKKIKPDRYILATSAKLTNKNKKELKLILGSCCTTTEDILGPEDLNNLLSKFPDIEDKHPKLWLSSVNVMQRVLHPGVLSMTSAEVSELREKLHLVVPTDDLAKVTNILEQRHVCIISGIPGIGKSTLADLAFLRYVSAGYQAVKIWSGMAEFDMLFDATKKQILYFDDFLGQAALDLRHNQAPKLAALIRSVQKSPNSRLVMTTREYILNRAKTLSQTIDDTILGLSPSVLALKDYSSKVRANILYNHVFFSDLPQEFKAEFSKPEVYRRIIRHPSFSPRIISLTLGRLPDPKHCTPSDYVEDVCDNLDNPYKVWKHAFRGLDTPGQHLAIVLMSLPRLTPVNDVRRVFDHFHGQQGDKYRLAGSAYDFDDALRELEGTFLATATRKEKIIVRYQNPSVEDFLRGHLVENEALLTDLVASCIQAEQLKQLSSRFWEDMTPPQSGVALQALHRVYDSPHLSAHNDEPLLGEEVFELAVAFWTDAQDPRLAHEMREIVQKFIHYLDAGTPHRLELSFLLPSIAKARIPGESQGGRLHRAMLEAILGTSGEWFPDLQDLTIMAEVIEQEDQFVPLHLKDEVRIAFEQSVEPELQDIEYMDEPEMMWNTLDDLELIADTLGVDLHDARDRVAHWVAELDAVQEEDDQEDGDTLEVEADAVADEEEIDAMLLRLRLAHPRK